MATHGNRYKWGTLPVAIVSVFLGISAFGFVTASIIFSRNLLAEYGPESIPVTGSPVIPLSSLGIILVAVTLGFLLGLTGLIAGCSSLPEKKEKAHVKICRWLTTIGITFSLITMFIDFILMSFLRTFVTVP